MTEQQVITIGTQLRYTRQSGLFGELVTVVGMTYYRGIRNERDHELLLEVQREDGSRFSDVYYHLDPI